ncbi:MAG TPA: GGDEF domain-containing protein [Methylibium sp.]|uniref:GGDEF domain-containing protein n=1 Tax=Methylibium sp. TaxID=2067992 RepID=UPI002DBD20C3|nr:GGDEF domain-containing protein [Methylibium sp.]HEU4458125.1 GGDEF domain-containing protein [Methylibium sp.]
MKPELSLVVLGDLPSAFAGSSWARFDTTACATLDELSQRLAAGPVDAVLLSGSVADEACDLLDWPGLSQACAAAAVVVAVQAPKPDLAFALLDRGVHDVVDADRPEALVRAVTLAVRRRQVEHVTRAAYATDLATGLPNQMQLLEHMSHMIALREREPAPMALLVIRVEGLGTAEAQLGPAVSAALRRKLAVRLRAVLRASDVVAAVGSDAFAALLAWIDSPQAAERVGVKAQRALQRPLRVAERELGVTASVGVAHCPAKGGHAATLLRDAFAQAAARAASGRAAGASRYGDLGGVPLAANDDSNESML